MTLNIGALVLNARESPTTNIRRDSRPNETGSDVFLRGSNTCMGESVQ